MTSSANLTNPISNNLFENGKDIEGIGNNPLLEGKKILEDGKEAIEQKMKEMKAKGLGVWNFLKKAGVMLGTALGVVAGLVAAGVVAITLPVSLPVLGCIAGGLFLGGTIAALVHNIKDPNVRGVKNVIIETLKDVGSNMLLAIPTIIAFIKDPEQIGKVINLLQAQAEDVKNDVKDLADILKNAGEQLKDETKEQLKKLQKKLQSYQNEINSLTKKNIPNKIDDLKTLKNNISGIIGNLKEKGKDLKTTEGRTFDAILDNLNKTLNNESLDKSFQKLNESFSKNIKKLDGSKDLDLSQVEIAEEIENEKAQSFLEGLNLSLISEGKSEHVIEDNMKKTLTNEKNGNYIPPKIEIHPDLTRENNIGTSIDQISDAFEKINWDNINCVAPDEIKASFKNFINIAKNTPNNTEKLEKLYSLTSAYAVTLCESNKDNKELLDLKNALDNFKILSKPHVSIIENDTEVDYGYHSFHDLNESLIKSAIQGSL